MPNAQIVNPTNAFGEPYPAQTESGQQNLLVVCSVAIAQWQTVAINTAGEAIVGTASNFPVGVAMEAGAIGQVIQVATSGSLVQGIINSGHVTAPALVVAVAAGECSSTVAAGDWAMGVALTTEATTGGLFTLWVQPHQVGVAA